MEPYHALQSFVKTYFGPTTPLCNGHATLLILTILALNAVLGDTPTTIQSTRASRLYRLSPIVCLYEISSFLTNVAHRQWSHSTVVTNTLPGSLGKDRKPWIIIDAKHERKATSIYRETLCWFLRTVSVVLTMFLFVSFDSIPFTRSLALIYGLNALLSASQVQRLAYVGSTEDGVQTAPRNYDPMFVLISHCWLCCTIMSLANLMHWTVFFVNGIIFITLACAPEGTDGLFAFEEEKDLGWPSQLCLRIWGLVLSLTFQGLLFCCIFLLGTIHAFGSWQQLTAATWIFHLTCWWLTVIFSKKAFYQWPLAALFGFSSTSWMVMAYNEGPRFCGWAPYLGPIWADF